MQVFAGSHETRRRKRQAAVDQVWQCRYSGIEVPDALWRYIEFGQGRKYSENQAEHMPEQDVWAPFDAWVDALAAFVARKGKVPPGRHRAYGYEPPKHRFADARLGWREVRMRLGHPPAGSSPAAQQELGLNRDATLRPAKGEGEKLR